LREDVHLEVRLAPEVVAARVDVAQLEQVLVNLAGNADDAMPGGGRLTVETTAAELDETFCRERPGVTAGPYAVLCVSDTGAGMDAETLAHVFDPFFSTKGTDHSGLGLASVHGIVRQAGGHVFVYSEPGRGTTFKVYLPRTAAPIAPQRLDAAPARAPRSALTVLVVDDEPLLRNTTIMLLERRGFRVLSAASGAEALATALAYAGTIDLLLTDVVMPAMGGRELAQRLRALRSDLRVLFVSGYTEAAIVHAGELDAGLHFLSKPFMPSALFDKVDRVLDSPVGGV
jgi:CheY-like chemotaxis protein